jgi:hypothetical protein
MGIRKNVELRDMKIQHIKACGKQLNDILRNNCEPRVLKII